MCEEKGTPYIVGGKVNWCRYYGEQYGGSLYKLKIELPYDPAIPLLSIHPSRKKTNSKIYLHPKVLAVLSTKGDY